MPTTAALQGEAGCVGRGGAKPPAAPHAHTRPCMLTGSRGGRALRPRVDTLWTCSSLDRPSSLQWAGDGSREHNGHWKPGRVSWLGPGRGPPLTYRGSGNEGLCGSEQEDAPLLRPHVNCCSPAGVRPGVGGHMSTAAGCPRTPDRKHNAHWVAGPGSCLRGKDAAPVACDLPLGFPSTVAGVARSMLEPSIKWMLSADTRVSHGGLPLWPRALSLGPLPVPQTRG